MGFELACLKKWTTLVLSPDYFENPVLVEMIQISTNTFKLQLPINRLLVVVSHFPNYHGFTCWDYNVSIGLNLAPSLRNDHPVAISR